MKFNATRNWLLIAFAVISPTYWIQYLLANRTDQTAMLFSAVLLIVAVVLLIFLLRKHYIEIESNQIIVQTPFRKTVLTPAEISKVSISQDVVSAMDTEGRIQHLMIPQKPQEFQELKKAVLNFCRQHQVTVTEGGINNRQKLNKTRIYQGCKSLIKARTFLIFL